MSDSRVSRGERITAFANGGWDTLLLHYSLAFVDLRAKQPRQQLSPDAARARLSKVALALEGCGRPQEQQLKVQKRPVPPHSSDARSTADQASRW
jgi:hypothetical protein